MINTNDPVCAVHSIEGNIAYIYGYGTYKGNNTNVDISLSNGYIVLDSGENILDLECLWGTPEALRKYLDKKHIVFIDPILVRKSQNYFDWKKTGLFVN